MKKIIVAHFIVLIAFVVKAGRDFSDKDIIEYKKQLNKTSMMATELHNTKTELAKAKEKMNFYRIAYEKTVNKHQELTAQLHNSEDYVQKLKLDNRKLIDVLEKQDAITPEIAKYIKRHDGRIPASSKK